jgi:hypothetical protein
MLDIITILWNSNARRYFHRQTISAFLCCVVEGLNSVWVHRHKSIPPVGSSLLNALAIQEEFRRHDPMGEIGEINKLWEDECLWLLIIRSQGRNLALACL